VGTSTEIYDYLKLLYARIGTTISPVSGQEVKKHSVTDVINFVKEQNLDEKWLLLAQVIVDNKRSLKEKLSILLQQGFARILTNNQTVRLEDYLTEFTDKNNDDELFIIIDRIVIKDDEDFYNRLGDAIDTAFYEGKGVV